MSVVAQVFIVVGIAVGAVIKLVWFLGRDPPKEKEVEHFDRQQVWDRLASIISDRLDVGKEKVSPESNFRWDLMADSLDKYELAYSAEEEFGIDIPDDVGLGFETVQDAYDYILKELGIS